MPRAIRKSAEETSPLILLRRIRDVMALPESAQSRLDKLVRVIAEQMGSEVCSVYLLRAGDVLELFASEGLKKESVHATRLHVGEGLVGEIAATGQQLNLADAQHHPKYVYKPETGEEIYHSFVGVPIMSTGRVTGVLVVQSKQGKTYTDDQIEVLQTVAMVLAELNDSGKLVSLSESQASGESMESLHLTGLKFAPGIARAPAVLHRRHIDVKMALTENPTEETERLERAVSDLRASIGRLIEESDLPEGDEQREIMESYLMFAQDKGWVGQIIDAIHGGLVAEAAVRSVQEQLHARLMQVESEYIRERMQDLEDVSNRLLEILSGKSADAARHILPDSFILIAKSLGPAELLEYGRHRIKGLVIEEGSGTSHIVVIARALEIPVVGRVPDIMTLVQQGDIVAVDGDAGDVYIRPTEAIERLLTELMQHKKERTEAYEKLRPVPPVTLDGERIRLYVNAGLFIDMKHLQDEGIEGVGLYRTELPYLISSTMPDVPSQSKIYSKVIKQSTGRTVVFRTFDIGGDKQLPYFPIDGEENPAMGWRATRIGLDRPAILRRQLRALIHSAAGHPLDVMFPFISQAREIDECRRLLSMEMERAKQEGFSPPSPIRVGAMIEVPSLIWQLPQLGKRVDFVSVGSNDLLQFFFACDRGSTHLSERYDSLAPEVLRALRYIVKECRKASIDLSFCGEMARKPLEAMTLIGLGFRNLSVPTPSLGPLKAMILSLNTHEIEGYLQDLLDSDEASLRGMLEAFAQDHKVQVD
jgi:phosphotransferase system enzyme I (PtsP)